MPQARIDSPDVLRDFRARFVAFDQTCRNALLSIDSDIKKLVAWLRSDQAAHLKQQLRKREEELNMASNEYSRAQMAITYLGKPSCIDEKKALDRARRRKEEAEERMEALRKWTRLLEHRIEKLIGPCRALSILLDQTTPRALERLDRMAAHLEDYLGSSPGGAS